MFEGCFAGFESPRRRVVGIGRAWSQMGSGCRREVDVEKAIRAHSRVDRALQRRKRAIDDLTTKWIAADRRPSRVETAFRCGIS
jgi:hypothetical protein